MVTALYPICRSYRIVKTARPASEASQPLSASGASKMRRMRTKGLEIWDNLTRELDGLEFHVQNVEMLIRKGEGAWLQVRLKDQNTGEMRRFLMKPVPAFRGERTAEVGCASPMFTERSDVTRRRARMNPDRTE